MCARATSIPIRHAPVVIRFRTPIRKASARLRKRRTSIQTCRCPQQAMPERHRGSRNLVFLRHQSRNVQCTRSGSSCPPSRVASEPAISRQESSNGGQTSSRSSETVRLPTVGSHPLSSPRARSFFLASDRAPLHSSPSRERIQVTTIRLTPMAISKPSNRCPSDLGQCMLATQLNNSGPG